MVNKTEKISVLYRIQEEIAIFPKKNNSKILHNIEKYEVCTEHEK
jgi:hypothetical protein